MTQCSMMGPTPRFDNDNAGSLLIHNECKEVEYIEDNDLIEFLKSQGEIPNNDEAQEIRAELPTKNIVDVADPNRPREDETGQTNTSIANNSNNNSETPKAKTQGGTETKGSKIIYKQKRRKTVQSESPLQIIEMKKQVLQLQKEYIEFEAENKKQVHDLIIENLKMDLKIKKAKSRRFNEGLDENGDSEPMHTDYCQYIDDE